jgi:uncharacterized membrane protein
MTAYPSQTTSPSILATTTPLFMITAWPTVSPVNVSAVAAAAAASASSPTATILGAVAVGVLGIVLIAGAVIYLRNGGTVAGLAEKVKANKGLITKAASMLPLTEEQKAKVNAAVNDPTSLLPEQAQQAIEMVKDCDQKAIAALPISDAQKAQLTSAVSSVKERVVKKVQTSPTGVLLTSVLGPTPVESTPVESKPVESKPVVQKQVMQKPVAQKPVAQKPVTQKSEETISVETIPEETIPEESNLEETILDETKPEESTPEAEPSLVTVHINPEDIESVKAFLAAKHANTTA